MDEQGKVERGEGEIGLGVYLSILQGAWWKIALFSLVTGAVTLLVLLRTPNMYRATAVITPASDEVKRAPSLGALASFGLMVGGPSRAEDLETLFKSNDLTVRVFRKYNLWPAVLADRIDPATGKIRASWMERFRGGGKEPKTPGDWDAIRLSKELLKVSVNRKAGTLSVSFESPSAEGSADIVGYYLDEGKSRLQEEALDRAGRNKKFIVEQIDKTADALTRDRLYSLYGQEVEKEMLARNREQFGFSIVDSPRIPDRKTRPARAKSAAVASLGGMLAACGYFLIRTRT